MLYSRIEALEDEVKTIKALSMSKGEKQYYEHRNLLVEGVRIAEKIKAATQNVAVAKRPQLSIRCQSLQNFEDSTKSSSQPLPGATSLHAAICTDESR